MRHQPGHAAVAVKEGNDRGGPGENCEEMAVNPVVFVTSRICRSAARQDDIYADTLTFAITALIDGLTIVGVREAGRVPSA